MGSTPRRGPLKINAVPLIRHLSDLHVKSGRRGYDPVSRPGGTIPSDHTMNERLIGSKRPPSFAEIQKALAKLLSWERISRSQTRSRLLSYVVEQALSGNDARIKAYSIAVEALGRSTDWDPQLDPIVRVEAMRLRSDLEEYYRSEGSEDRVIILLPKGRYVPSFTWSEAVAGEAELIDGLVGEPDIMECPNVEWVFQTGTGARPAHTASLETALRYALNEAVPRFCFIRSVSGGAEPWRKIDANKASTHFTIQISFVTDDTERLPYTYRVIENINGTIIWQGRGVAENQDDIWSGVTKLCGAVLGHSGCIHRHNLARMLSGHAFGQQYECFLRYLNIIRIHGDPIAETEVRSAFEAQLQHDYGFALGYTCLAHLLFRLSLTQPLGWTQDHLMLRAWHLALRGTELNPANGFAQATLYWLSDIRGESHVAETALNAAKVLNPYDAEIMLTRGARLICTGRHQEGIELIERWLVPEVGYPVQYLFYLALGKYLIGDLEGCEAFGLRIPADIASGSQSHPGAFLLRALIAQAREKHELARSAATAMHRSIFRSNIGIEDFVARYVQNTADAGTIVTAFEATKNSALV